MLPKFFKCCRGRCRNRFRKNRVRPCRKFRMLLLGRVRGSSAAGPEGRPPSFPRKKVGGAPGVLTTYGTACTEK